MTTILVHESASSARNLPYWMVLISNLMSWSDFNEHKVRLINRSSCNNIVKFLNKDVKRHPFSNDTSTNGVSSDQKSISNGTSFRSKENTTKLTNNFKEKTDQDVKLVELMQTINTNLKVGRNQR